MNDEAKERSARVEHYWSCSRENTGCPCIWSRIESLEAQLAEARKTALELELHAANQGSTPSVKWTGEDGRVRSLLTSTPMETRAALESARNLALEEAALEAESFSASWGDSPADAAAGIRRLKSVKP